MGGCFGGWAVAGSDVVVGLDALPDTSKEMSLATRDAAATPRFVPVLDSMEYVV